MQITRDMSKGQIVALQYNFDNLSTAGGTLATNHSLNVNYVTAPFAGELLGMAVNTSAASTHASAAATFSFSRNSTSISGATTVISSSTVNTYSKYPRNTYRFLAGDELGVKFVAAAGFGPNTIDAGVTLFVKFDVEGV